LELSRANEKLRDLDKMKSEFVSLATHQLRTPLSGVRWSLSMLLNGEMGPLTPDQKIFMMKTYESNNRMITLINDMLQADRVESGTLKFKFTPTNLAYLFQNILLELRPLAEKRGIKLIFVTEPY
jgi:signal transduction histidine kinase